MRHEISYEGVKRHILEWNNKFPVDRWWRTKHKIAFNSESHRNFSFIDMFVEYIEDTIFDEYTVKEADEDKYIPGQANWLKQYKMSEEDIDKAFNDIDIS